MPGTAVLLLWVLLGLTDTSPTAPTTTVDRISTFPTNLDETSTVPTTLDLTSAVPTISIQANNNCTAPWNVSVTKDLQVRWVGIERDATVFVDIIPDQPQGNNCLRAPLSFSAKFEEEAPPVFQLPCLNTEYRILVSLNCEDKIVGNLSRVVWTEPDAPSSVRVEDLKTSGFNVVWDPPPGPIEEYWVKVISSESFFSEKSIMGASVLMAGLTPRTVHNISVSAKNKNEWGRWSKAITVETKSIELPVPQDFRKIEVTSVTIQVQWNEVIFEDYQVSYTVQWSNNAKLRGAGVNGTSFTIRRLTPFSTYFVRVRARVNEVMGDWSNPLVIKTLPGIPMEPQDLSESKVDSTFITVTWKEPAPSSGPIKFYTVMWRLLDSATAEQGNTVDSFYVIGNLIPLTTYAISVRASTASGTGNWTSELQVQTTRPVPPENLKPIEVSSNMITVQWDEPKVYKGRGIITAYSVRWSKSGITPRITQNTSELSITIGNLEPSQSYSVQVRGLTKDGSSDWTDPLIVQTTIGTPLPPENVHEGKVTNTSVEVQWDVPVLYKALVIQHSVKWGMSDSEDMLMEIVNTSRSPYVIKDLEPFTDYSIFVRSWTEDGPGNWAGPLIVQTDIGVPLSPGNITVTPYGRNSLQVQWDEPQPYRGKITSYSIQWAERGSKTMSMDATNSTKYLIRNLSHYTWYEVQVQASTDAGDGEWSKLVEGRTAIGIPSVPKNLREKTPSSNTTIEVQWNEPDPTNGPIANYTVRWTNLNNNITKQEVTIEKNYLIRNLNPFTNHSIQVRAATTAGYGKWTEVLVIRTDIGIPYEPQNVTVGKVTDTSIQLSWQEPEPFVGHVIYYIVEWIDIVSKKREIAKINHLYHTIKDLLPYRNYSLSICAVTNAGLGKCSDTVVTRTLSGVPKAPKNIQQIEATNLTICIKWDEPIPFKGPILSYTVRWKHAVTLRTDTGSTNISNYCIPNLEPFTFYGIDVKARTNASFGPWSETLSIQTAIGIPTIIKQVEIQDKTAWSIHITWLPPDALNGPLKNYEVVWGKAGGSTVKNLTENASFHAENLIPFTEYSFQVSASTELGFGPLSKPVLIRTDISEPSAPIDLDLVLATNISLALKWKEPVSPNGPILVYKVKWEKTFEKRVNGEFEVQSLECLVQDLDPYTNYSVQVSARTMAGFGPWSDVLETSTKIGVPKPAQLHSVKSESSRSIVVEWSTLNPYPGPTTYVLEVWSKPDICDNGIKPALKKVVRGPRGMGEWKFSRQETVENLIPYTEYYVSILLNTSVAKSKIVNSSVVKTLPDSPGPPKLVEADCKKSTETEVRWKTPSDPNGKIVEYLVRYGVEYSGWYEKAVPVLDECRDDHRIRLEGLRPERKYKIYVRAKAEGVEENGAEASLKGHCILPAGEPPVSNFKPLRMEGSGPHTLTLEWSQDVFSDTMGELVNYAVLVGVSEAVGNATSGRVAEMLPTWSNFSDGSSYFYQATPLEWNPFDEEKGDPLQCQKLLEEDVSNSQSVYRCTVGLQRECASEEIYCNGPLRPGTNYGVKLRAFTRGGFSETDPLFANTDPIKKTSSIVGAIIGGLLALLVLSAFIAATIILRRKGKLVELRIALQTRFGRQPTAPPPPPEQVLQLEACTTLRSLYVRNFAEHVRIMMSDSHLRFSQEFEILKKNSPKFPCLTAEMEENRPKNRWLNIFPYDHSRVKLLPLGDEPASDFVNANYIPGYSSLREYIASQGPLANTVDDFWRMVWEQSVSMIVMLTQCVERGKNKCEQYWPDAGEAKHYGDMQVRTISESMLSSYIIRLFHVQLGSQERRVKQMHFTHWPDFGCPESPDDLINFIRAVRDHLPRFKPGPILVHCSAGVGRTGTFIAVDTLSQQLRNTDTIDIFNTVMQLRHHRINMVQTEDQYIYIHLCMKQLIDDISEPRDNEYEEAIYSNIGMDKDTGV